MALFESDRVANLGRLVGSLGHELNNLAAVLVGALTFIQDQAAAGAPPEEPDIESLAYVARRLEEHARQLAYLSRAHNDGGDGADLESALEATLARLNLAGKTKYIEVTTRLPATPFRVPMPRTVLEHMLMSLLLDAAEARSDDQEAWSVRVDATLTESAEGQGLTLRVSDRGEGRARVGLASAVRLVERSGGRARVEEGKGQSCVELRWVIPGGAP